MPQMHRSKTPGNALGQFLPKVTKKAFEKYGFATASLATDWAMIVGTDTAGKAVPERITWPRVREPAPEDTDAGCGRQGATLTLRVRPAFAIEIQYGLQTIADRVNSYFGYRAIDRIKILQGEFASAAEPVGGPRGKPGTMGAAGVPVAAPGVSEPTARLPLQDVRNDKLKDALERLAANVLQS